MRLVKIEHLKKMNLDRSFKFYQNLLQSVIVKIVEQINRYNRIISISLPLVFSMAATTVMEFTDRVFLANYSIDAIAAAMPAGISAFLVLTLFTGISSYLNVFIAQYTGAGKLKQIGTCLWQGILFSMIAWILLIIISFLGEDLFRLGGHPIEIQKLENTYFSVLCLGGGLNVLGTALACFFSGQGKTRPVMVINMIGMIFNIPLDYALINGAGIFPELGIMGAGIATVSSWALIALLYCLFIFNRGNDRQYNIISCRKIDWELFNRILMKGGPAALQFTMDVLAFTFFIFLVGRLGKLELAISNIVFSIQAITFMPAIGFSIGLSTLVGQALGSNDVSSAIRFTRQTLNILLAYTISIGVIFMLFPQSVFKIFIAAETSSATVNQMLLQGKMIVRIMAVFICFDAMYFTLLGVLKGAGDTRFIMWSIGGATLFIMAIPLTWIVIFSGWGLYACWINLSFYVFSLFLISYLRYRQGKWKDIRVI